MSTTMWTIILGFLEGVGLILSPCILPILPIVLATSLTGSRRRPFGITCGFVFCFAVVAFFSRQLVNEAHIDLDSIRKLSYGLLFFLGLVMVSSQLTAYWGKLLSFLQGQFGTHTSLKQEGFWSGFVFGGLVSLVWVPCAGPILAAVIVQTVVVQENWVSFLVLAAFSLGAALPMLWIAVYGKVLLSQFGFFRTKLGVVRQALGLLIMMSVGWMVIAETYIAPTTVTTSIKTATALQNGLFSPYRAPALTDITAWINTSAQESKAYYLQGRVTLIDFWTYSCINCLRTIPYLNEFYTRYHQQGLDIIGVHAPEFAFEKDLQRVEKAVQKNHIVYPVALDNHFATWMQFHNHYWPAQYLIDQQGFVVYEHFGEGAEDVLENNIRYLLHLKKMKAEVPPALSATLPLPLTPETYLGYARADSQLRPARYVPNKTTIYQFTATLHQDAWDLAGRWQVKDDHILSMGSDAALKMHFRAKALYLVMGSVNQRPLQVSVILNGQEIKTLTVMEHTIYPVLVLGHVEEGEILIRVKSPGLAIYTMTFGG